MGFNLGDELIKALRDKTDEIINIERGKVFVVKTKPFYEKTKIKLYIENESEEKSRPLIVLYTGNQTFTAFALSSKSPALVFQRKTRLELSLKSCNLHKEDCFRIIFKDKAYVFILKDDYKIRVNINAFKELLNQSQAKFCGKCSEELLNYVEKYYT
jgi:hypothetical protein